MPPQLALPSVESDPKVDVRVDWLSLTAHFEQDRAISELKEAVVSAVFDHFETREHLDCEHNANYLEGVHFRKAGIRLRWTSYTRCQLNGFSEEGRCAGTMNLVCTGKSSIGALPLDRALSFVKALVDLGFRSAARWDLAVDCYDQPGIGPEDIYKELAAGCWRIPRRSTCSILGEFQQGSDSFQSPTLYLGAVKSDNFVRIYDRAKVLGVDRLITRFERQTRGKFAQSLLESFQALANVAWDQPCAQQRFREWLLSAVRCSCDIRQIGHWANRELPANWAKLSDPAWLMDVVFGQTKPLEIGEVVLRGGYAASYRHMLRSSGRVLAMHAVELEAAGSGCPDALLHMVGFKVEMLTEEDFQELVQGSTEGLSLIKVRKAALKLERRWYGLTGNKVQVSDVVVDAAEKLEGELGGVVTPPQKSRRKKKAS